MNDYLAVLHLVLIFEEAARRRSRGSRAVFVKHAAVARTHEQPRFLEPAHRASEMRAVDGEHLEFFAFDAAHPARDVAGLAVPGLHERVFECREVRIVLGEIADGTERDPGAVLFASEQA